MSGCGLGDQGMELYQLYSTMADYAHTGCFVISSLRNNAQEKSDAIIMRCQAFTKYMQLET